MARVRVVKEDSGYSPWWWLVIAALATLLLWQMYEVGSQRGALRVGENLDDRAALLAVQDRSFVVLEEQQTRIRELSTQLDTQRKLTELEVQAGIEMQKELQSVLLEQHQLLEQVQFYENIVGTEASKAGIRVTEIRLRPGETEQLWWLNITMTQVKKHDIRATGKINIALYGKLNGTPQELTLKQLHPEELSAIKFGYRYFQMIAVPLQLPEGFWPEDVTVEFSVKRPKVSQLLEQREWVELQR